MVAHCCILERGNSAMGKSELLVVLCLLIWSHCVGGEQPGSARSTSAWQKAKVLAGEHPILATAVSVAAFGAAAVLAVPAGLAALGFGAGGVAAGACLCWRIVLPCGAHHEACLTLVLRFDSQVALQLPCRVLQWRLEALALLELGQLAQLRVACSLASKQRVRFLAVTRLPLGLRQRLLAQQALVLLPRSVVARRTATLLVAA